jgi:hypothetical protein
LIFECLSEAGKIVVVERGILEMNVDVEAAAAWARTSHRLTVEHYVSPEPAPDGRSCTIMIHPEPLSFTREAL